MGKNAILTPEPVTLAALGVAIGKLLLRWADLNDTADAVEDARAGFAALRSLRAKKATDPVSAATVSYTHLTLPTNREV